MRKLILLMCLILGSRVLVAQEDTLAIMIWAEDAVGNKDTVFIYLKENATDGLDPELGEVNLYGVPPQGDLDLRIIQRTDTNYFSDTGAMSGIPWWLMGYYQIGGPGNYFSYGWCAPYLQNVDMKKNYVWNWADIQDTYNWCKHFAIYCNAINYPVKIYMCDIHSLLGNGRYGVIRCSEHNTINGILIWDNTLYGQREISCDDANPYIIQDAEQNYILFFEFCGITAMREDSTDINITYPNPAENYTILDNASTGKYNLINSGGIILKTFNIEAIPYLLDVSNLPTGSYYITNDFRQYLYKFIKEGGNK